MLLYVPVHFFFIWPTGGRAVGRVCVFLVLVARTVCRYTLSLVHTNCSLAIKEFYDVLGALWNGSMIQYKSPSCHHNMHACQVAVDLFGQCICIYAAAHISISIFILTFQFAAAPAQVRRRLQAAHERLRINKNTILISYRFCLVRVSRFLIGRVTNCIASRDAIETESHRSIDRTYIYVYKSKNYKLQCAK